MCLFVHGRLVCPVFSFGIDLRFSLSKANTSTHWLLMFDPRPQSLPVSHVAVPVALLLQGVSVVYPAPPGGQVVRALDRVDLTLTKGSFHFLTGPSGAGKSSLLRLCFGALRPATGVVMALGQDMSQLDRDGLARLRRRIGVVFQDFRLLDHLSVFENVALPLRVAGQAEARYRADVTEILQWVGLGARLRALPPMLSAGEKQRAAIARAVVTAPELILADEPTGNLDSELAKRIMDLFFQLHRLGRTVLVATHDHHLVRDSGMAVLHLSEGRLQQRGW